MQKLLSQHKAGMDRETFLVVRCLSLYPACGEISPGQTFSCSNSKPRHHALLVCMHALLCGECIQVCAQMKMPMSWAGHCGFFCNSFSTEQSMPGEPPSDHFMQRMISCLLRESQQQDKPCFLIQKLKLRK